MSVIVKKAKEQIEAVIKTAALKAMESGALCEAELPAFTTETPANREHGDYAVNAAMVWARAFKSAPRKIAEIITENADFDGTYIDRAEIAGPGFINLFLNDSYYADILLDIEEKKESYGSSDYGEN